MSSKIRVNQRISQRRLLKVQGGKTLRFCFMLLACFAVCVAGSLSDAAAQSNDVTNRLNRLENELETLNRAVYRGEKPSTPVYRGAGVGGNETAQIEIRLQQMETQLRDLTGQLEKQTYEMNRLRQKVELLSLPEAKAPDVSLKNEAKTNALPEIVKNKKLDLGFIPPEPQGMKQAVPGGANLGGVDATAQYEAAFAYLKAQKYEDAQNGFQSFLDGNKEHVLAANAKYWLGETYYTQGKYKQAAKNFAEGFQTYPDSAKSPDILLKLGMSLGRMDKAGDACIALAQVAKKFPVGHDNVIALADQERERLGCE
ncbi:MAG: tol-pal system protein YbgF [Alphaproteobacteria bacterium]|nr:tol-pal system protein YbgF [Alphaproteobacteria bacterium]